MARDDTVVVICCCDQRGGITHIRFDVMKRRVCPQVSECHWITGSSVLRSPRCAACKLVVPQHVHDADLGYRNSEQIWTLYHHSTNQQSSIRSAIDSQMWSRCVFLLYE